MADRPSPAADFCNKICQKATWTARTSQPTFATKSALFGHAAMTDLSPKCTQEQKSGGGCTTAVIVMSGRDAALARYGFIEA